MTASGPLDEILLKIVRDIANYQFGRNAGEKIFPDDCRVEVSKRTGRPRYVYLRDEVIATIRYPDNLIALTPKGAERLRDALGERAPRITVKREKVEKVRKGVSPAAGDMIACSDAIRPGDEVLVESEDGEMLAVGRAIISAQTMKEVGHGAIVKIRKTCKT